MRYRATSYVLFAAIVAALPCEVRAQSDSVAVFRQAIDARNRGDITAMMALFADDAVREDGSCQPPCVGLAAVKKSFQTNIDEHFHANVTSAQGAGDTVTAAAEITSDAFRAQGIDKRMTSYTVQLRGGKIVRMVLPVAATGTGKKELSGKSRQFEAASDGGLVLLSAFVRSRFERFQHFHNVTHFPEAISDASRHCGCHL